MLVNYRMLLPNNMPNWQLRALDKHSISAFFRLFHGQQKYTAVHELSQSRLFLLRIPNEIINKYVAHLNKRIISTAQLAEYTKWLRYYLDFCDKYPVPTNKAERVRLFCEKLKDKKQSEKQREWAAHAVSLYFEMSENKDSTLEELVSGSGHEVFSSANRPLITPEAGTRVKLGRIPSQESYYFSEDAPRYSTCASRKSQYTDAGYQEKSASPEWDKVLESMASDIKVRHYSRKTLKTYALWSRNFQRFLKDKPPEKLSTEYIHQWFFPQKYLTVTAESGEPALPSP
jgi:hypothetical protein